MTTEEGVVVASFATTTPFVFMNGKSLVFAYVVWLVLLVAALLVVNQVYIALIFWTTSAIETENFNELGWNIYTISGFARFYIFVLGLVWMFWLGITEHLLVAARSSGLMWCRAGRLAFILVVVFALAYLSLIIPS